VALDATGEHAFVTHPVSREEDAWHVGHSHGRAGGAQRPGADARLRFQEPAGSRALPASRRRKARELLRLLSGRLGRELRDALRGLELGPEIEPIQRSPTLRSQAAALGANGVLLQEVYDQPVGGLSVGGGGFGYGHHGFYGGGGSVGGPLINRRVQAIAIYVRR
jgi:hypothetical protein